MSSSDRPRLVRQYRFVSAPPPGDALAEPGVPVDVAPGAASAEMADVVLGQARAEASRIVAEGYAQVESLRQQARDEGYQAGWEQGYAEGQARAEQEAREEIAAVRRVLDTMAEQRAQLVHAAEADLADLALAIARKVIDDIAASQVEAIEQMATLAARRLGAVNAFSIHLHPEDARRLAAYWQEHGARADWELVPDERIATGGCVVTSGASSVDARPETQLAWIQQAFRGLQGERWTQG